jgi:hypothetical protein
LKGKIAADGSLTLKVVYSMQTAAYSVEAYVAYTNGNMKDITDKLSVVNGVGAVGSSIDFTAEANELLANEAILANMEIDTAKSVLNGTVAEDGSLKIVIVITEKKMAVVGTSGTTATTLTSADAAYIKDATTQAALAAEIAEKGSVIEIKTEWGNIGVANLNYSAARQRYNADGSTRYLVVRAYMPEGYTSKFVTFSEQRAISPTPVKAGEWIDYVIDMKIAYENYDSPWGVLTLVERLKVDGFNYTYFSDLYFTDTNPQPDALLVWTNTITVVTAANGTATTLTDASAGQVKDEATQAALAAEIAEKGSIIEVSMTTDTIGGKGFDYNLAKTFYLIDGSTRYMIVRAFIVEEYKVEAVQYAQGAAKSNTPVETGKWVDYVIDMKAYYESGSAGWGVFGCAGTTKIDGKCIFYISTITFRATNPA